MKPEIFPSEEIQKLYEELEEQGYSPKGRYKKLLDWNLATTFSADKHINYIHPNHKWRTYMFRIPVCSSGKAQERTNRSKFVAFKNVVIKWVFGKAPTEDVDEKFFSAIKKWFAKHMTGYATVSIPEFLADNFEDDFKRTQSEIVCITPELEYYSCPECSYLFIAELEDTTLECPDCGFTFVK